MIANECMNIIYLYFPSCLSCVHNCDMMINYIFSPEIVEREYFSLGSLHKPIKRLPCFWCSAVKWLDLVEGLWSVNLQCCRELHLYSLVEVKPSFWLFPSSCQYAWFLLAGFQKKSFCADLGEGHTIQGEGRTVVGLVTKSHLTPWFHVYHDYKQFILDKILNSSS